jgi:hypothetical protein
VSTISCLEFTACIIPYSDSYAGVSSSREEKDPIWLWQYFCVSSLLQAASQSPVARQRFSSLQCVI